MNKSTEDLAGSVHLSIHLSHDEAEGLALLCKILDWDFLMSHTAGDIEATKARYTLARLRFALSDAGYQLPLSSMSLRLEE